MKRGPLIAALVFDLLALGSPALADATVTNGILSVSPAVATQGVSGLTVTFILSSTNTPPVPPAGIAPSTVTIGTNSGSMLTHTSQYVITAQFGIPMSETVGVKDVAVSLPFPNGTLTYNRLQAFRVVAGSGNLAGFTATPTYGAPPLTVTFTNSSAGAITNQLWRFGDNTTSVFLNPSHVYTNTGNYTVSLTVFGAGGSNTLTRDGYITVTTNLVSYLIVDTAQTNCYNTNSIITAPLPGQPFYGQDAQFFGNQPGYALSGDGKTVYDKNTGLTWMRGPNTTLTTPVKTDKKTFSQAQAWVAAVNATNYGGFSDWRLPSIKELYSLMNFKGTDPSSFNGSDTSVLTPFIDTTYFLFAYGQTNLGERIIDSQYASSDVFVVNPAETGSPKLFGLNLADGRIKGYDLTMPDGITEKTFFVQLVRGPLGYGVNNFTNNGDGTVTDLSTGLMWARTDNGSSMLWSNALAWVQARNAANYLGHNDWRMPNAKELHSVVDYANAPDYNGKPAVDTAFFTCTVITNEAGAADYPYYWASTTHAGYSAAGSVGGAAVYIPFGRGLGWPDSAGRWVDVHGAGCQRSDPKVGPPYLYATNHTVITNGTTYTGYAFGPQGDAIRGLNYVRLVRVGNNSSVDHVGDGIPDWWRRQYFGGSGTTTNAASCSTCDIDGDGMTTLEEYLADTNPTNASSRLAIIGVASQTNGTQIAWIGGTGVRQVVERSPTLFTNQWSAIFTNVPPTSTTNFFMHTGAAASNLFYRIEAHR